MEVFPPKLSLLPSSSTKRTYSDIHGASSGLSALESLRHGRVAGLAPAHDAVVVGQGDTADGSSGLAPEERLGVQERGLGAPRGAVGASGRRLDASQRPLDARARHVAAEGPVLAPAGGRPLDASHGDLAERGGRRRVAGVWRGASRGTRHAGPRQWCSESDLASSGEARPTSAADSGSGSDSDTDQRRQAWRSDGQLAARDTLSQRHRSQPCLLSARPDYSGVSSRVAAYIQRRRQQDRAVRVRRCRDARSPEPQTVGAGTAAGSDGSGDDDGGASGGDCRTMAARLALERAERKERERQLEQLQTEYAQLVTKFAEAETYIDRMRFQRPAVKPSGEQQRPAASRHIWDAREANVTVISPNVTATSQSSLFSRLSGVKSAILRRYSDDEPSFHRYVKSKDELLPNEVASKVSSFSDRGSVDLTSGRNKSMDDVCFHGLSSSLGSISLYTDANIEGIASSVRVEPVPPEPERRQAAPGDRPASRQSCCSWEPAQDGSARRSLPPGWRSGDAVAGARPAMTQVPADNLPPGDVWEAHGSQPDLQGARDLFPEDVREIRDLSRGSRESRDILSEDLRKAHDSPLGDLLGSHDPPPGDLRGAHDPPPGDLRGAHDPPPGNLRGAHDSPPGDLRGAHDPPPGDLRGAHDPPPGEPREAQETLPGDLRAGNQLPVGDQLEDSNGPPEPWRASVGSLSESQELWLEGQTSSHGSVLAFSSSSGLSPNEKRASRDSTASSARAGYDQVVCGAEGQSDGASKSTPHGSQAGRWTRSRAQSSAEQPWSRVPVEDDPRGSGCSSTGSSRPRAPVSEDTRTSRDFSPVSRSRTRARMLDSLLKSRDPAAPSPQRSHGACRRRRSSSEPGCGRCDQRPPAPRDRLQGVLSVLASQAEMLRMLVGQRVRSGHHRRSLSLRSARNRVSATPTGVVEHVEIVGAPVGGRSRTCEPCRAQAVSRHGDRERSAADRQSVGLFWTGSERCTRRPPAGSESECAACGDPCASEGHGSADGAPSRADSSRDCADAADGATLPDFRRDDVLQAEPDGRRRRRRRRRGPLVLPLGRLDSELADGGDSLSSPTSPGTVSPNQKVEQWRARLADVTPELPQPEEAARAAPELRQLAGAVRGLQRQMSGLCRLVDGLRTPGSSEASGPPYRRRRYLRERRGLQLPLLPDKPAAPPAAPAARPARRWDISRPPARRAASCERAVQTDTAAGTDGTGGREGRTVSAQTRLVATLSDEDRTTSAPKAVQGFRDAGASAQWDRASLLARQVNLRSRCILEGVIRTTAC